jgi:AraC-like DNA-binding protein
MKENPHLSIPEYASQCQISESLLYHYVKRSSGKTPNQLRQEILCEKAAELLFTTSYTIEEICDKLGFSSAAYFRKVFHSVYHTSPSKMRKKENMI